MSAYINRRLDHIAAADTTTVPLNHWAQPSNIMIQVIAGTWSFFTTIDPVNDDDTSPPNLDSFFFEDQSTGTAVTSTGVGPGSYLLRNFPSEAIQGITTLAGGDARILQQGSSGG